jgi:predicted MFS family arabinose efflux permease
MNPEGIPPAADTRIGRREMLLLLLLASVQFTSIVDFMVIMPLGPQLRRLLNINPSQFGLIVSSYTISAGIAGILASSFMDRFGRKAAFLILFTGFLAGTFLCGLVRTYQALLAARVVTGAFGGILGGMALAIVGDVFPEHKRGRATGVLMSAFALASVVGVPAGIALGNRFDWHAPFLVLAALGLPVLLTGSFLLPPLRDHLHEGPHPDPLARLVETVSHPNHVRAFALVATMMIGGFSVIPYISLYVVGNAGVREIDLPILYITGGLLTLFGAPVVGKFADRIGKLKVYRIIAGFSTLLILLITNLPRWPLVLVAAATGIFMLANAGRMVAALAMVTGSVEPQRRGGFMSANSAVQHFSTGLGSWVGSLLITGNNADASIQHFNRVGYLAVAATLVSLWLAGRVKPAGEYKQRETEIPAIEAVLEDPISAAETL